MAVELVMDILLSLSALWCLEVVEKRVWSSEIAWRPCLMTFWRWMIYILSHGTDEDLEDTGATQKQ